MLIYGFNETCKNTSDIYLEVGNESVSVIRFCTKEKGNSPHLSYIFCKPEPLGTELKTMACSVTGSLFFIYIYRGKEGTNNRKYHLELRATKSFTKRMAEATKGLYLRYVKGDTDNCFIFDSWFASNNSAESAMDVGVEIVGMVKPIKIFFKDTIENLPKDYPGDYYLILKIKSLLPGERLLIAIGCRYNVRKVLFPYYVRF